MVFEGLSYIYGGNTANIGTAVFDGLSQVLNMWRTYELKSLVPPLKGFRELELEGINIKLDRDGNVIGVM